VAGLNASLGILGQESAIFQRADSYIGVMVDDLVTRGVTEPYRMFTSRAEFRLSLRADNADQRLTPFGLALGCVGEPRRRAFEAKMERLDAARDRLEGISWTAREIAGTGVNLAPDGPRRTAFDVLGLPDVAFDALLALEPALADIDAETREQLGRDALYAKYVHRQARDVEAMRRDEAESIPEDFDFAALSGLSNELKQKLLRSRPATLAQAGRVEGMTPAALTLILAKLRQRRRKSA
jgi:tRNA uridine 5-carboxymethylaminomethyl modification enzyme